MILGFFTQNDDSLITPLAVSLGAIPGALSRYYLTIGLAQWLGTRFPFGTFVINLSGALLMGFVATLVGSQVITSPKLQILMINGFLGSYTTFSTFALDTSILLRNGSYTKAMFYWLASMVLGGICLEVGIILANMIGSN
jgi:CrcB protein